MKSSVKVFAMILITVLLVQINSSIITVHAAGSSFSGGYGVSVSSNNTVADSITYNGVTVNAIYRPYDGTNGTDTTYSCAAFVKKFYSATKGVSVYNLSSTTSVPLVSSGGGSFSLTTSPKVGDIVRDNESTHWAIVKSVDSSGKITVIQQNAWLENRTKAWVGAYTTTGNSRYSYFTYNSSSSSVQYTSVTAEKQSDTVFKIQAELNSTYSITTAGFYLGTSTSNMTKVNENVNTSAKYIYYTIGGGSKWWSSLQVGTTYYYKFYATIGGKTYETGIYSFTTGTPGVSVSKFGTPTAEKITDTSYKIKGTLDGQYTVSTAGFYLGTSTANMSKITETVNSSGIKYVYYTLGDGSKWWSSLSSGTTYYYKIYAIINGTEYQTTVQSFTTPQNNVDLSNCTITLSQNSYTYSGKENKPTITVKSGSTTLTNGTHYTVSYNNNVNVGTATAKVTAVNGSGYTGSVSKSFSITKAGQTIDASISSSSITVGNTSQISANAKTNLSFSSSNTSVATVNSSGLVTGIAEGTATITIKATSTANYNESSKTITITVIDPIKDFVRRLYTNILGREAETIGLNYWTQELKGNNKTAAQAALEFVFSEEFIAQNNNDSVFLDRLYQTFFNREADPSGKTYWQNYLNKGVTRKHVTAQFINSSEFTSVCENYGMQRGNIELTNYSDINANLTMFVVRCYREIQNREAEADGLEYWCKEIYTRHCDATQAAKSFIASPEFTSKNLSNPEYVQVLYKAFMDRSADSNGLTYWINLLNNGTSRTAVLESFASSPEFQNIISSFGL